MLAIPIPLPMTDTRFPLYVPVYPSMPRTSLNNTASFKKFSAINLALNGSPGIKTTFATSSIFALLCAVDIISS